MSVNRSGHGSLSPRSRNDQRRELDRHLIVDRSGDRVHLSLNGVIEILTPDEAIRLGQAIVSAGRVAATKGGRAGT